MDDDPAVTRTLDCLGLYCPEPLFQTREAIDAIEVGEVLEVLSDDPAAEEDLTSFRQARRPRSGLGRERRRELRILMRRLT